MHRSIYPKPTLIGALARALVPGLILLGALSLSCSDEDTTGIAGDLRIDQLSFQQMSDLCIWVIDHQGGPNFLHQCDATHRISTDGYAECVEEREDYDGCDLTVSQMEGCILAAGPNPCFIPQTPECEPLMDCLFGPPKP